MDTEGYYSVHTCRSPLDYKRRVIFMTFAELAKEAMNVNLDDLENRIDNLKTQIKILEDVKKLRNQTGEYSTKQQVARQKRAKAKEKKNNN